MTECAVSTILLSGYLNSLIQLICDYFVRKFSPQSHQKSHDPSTIKTPIETESAQQAPWPAQPNNLISNANQMAETNFNFTIKQ